MPETETTFGQRLGMQMDAQELDPETLAAMVGINTASVYRYRGDRGLPAFDVLARLAKVFDGLTLGDLLVLAGLATPEDLRVTVAAEADATPEDIQLAALRARAERYLADDTIDEDDRAVLMDWLISAHDQALQQWRQAFLERRPRRIEPSPPQRGKR